MYKDIKTVEQAFAAQKDKIDLSQLPDLSSLPAKFSRGMLAPVARKPSPQKEWLELNLQWWCNENAVELQGEYQFAGDRKWRFDWAIRALKIGIEYEGIYSAKSRHTTHSGFTGDIEKYNRAQLEGWTVLRYTAKDYKNVLRDLDKILLTTPNRG